MEDVLTEATDRDHVPPTVHRKGRRAELRIRRLPVTFTSDIRRVITRFAMISLDSLLNRLIG